MERFARVTALASGAMLAPLAASAHFLVPALFGTDWAPAADPLPWASAGLLVAGPISVAAAGYLYSEKDVRTPLIATVINGAVWIALTAVLLRPMGLVAVGVLVGRAGAGAGGQAGEQPGHGGVVSGFAGIKPGDLLALGGELV